jgi:hypothetical protein
MCKAGQLWKIEHCACASNGIRIKEEAAEELSIMRRALQLYEGRFYMSQMLTGFFKKGM